MADGKRAGSKPYRLPLHPLAVPVLPIKEPRLASVPALSLRVVPHRSRLSPDTSPATGFDHKVLPQEKHWLDHAIAVVVSVDRACHAIADSMIGRYALDLLRARRARKSRR